MKVIAFPCETTEFTTMHQNSSVNDDAKKFIWQLNSSHIDDI